MEGETSEVTCKHHARQLTFETRGRGTYNITQEVEEVVRAAGVQAGLCNVFVHHTSASVILCENADPTVREDLERFAARFSPDGDPIFEHRDEGPDDMPAHIRTVFTQSSLCIPISDGGCDLGAWQGIYLWEHRHQPHRRRVTISVVGSAPT
jgi:secondary thiamine-phosphate synthase enzyme